eukprot:766137-Prymnesium_polylepis.1
MIAGSAPLSRPPSTREARHAAALLLTPSIDSDAAWPSRPTATTGRRPIWSLSQPQNMDAGS